MKANPDTFQFLLTAKEDKSITTASEKMKNRK